MGIYQDPLSECRSISWRERRWDQSRAPGGFVEQRFQPGRIRTLSCRVRTLSCRVQDLSHLSYHRSYHLEVTHGKVRRRSSPNPCSTKQHHDFKPPHLSLCKWPLQPAGFAAQAQPVWFVTATWRKDTKDARTASWQHIRSPSVGSCCFHWYILIYS